MRLLIINLGSMSECLVSTSVINEMSKDGYTVIDVLVKDKFNAAVFRYHPKIENVFILDKLPKKILNYDKVANLHPSFSDNIIDFSDSEKVGFNYSENSDQMFKILYGYKKTDKNVFQIYFNLVGKVWKGQGVDFHYFPRSKTKKDRTGIAISNRNLREFIIKELKLDETKIWFIPYKKSIFRKADEINVCKYIITDDFLLMNLSVMFRKNVHFLKTIPYNYDIEMFNSGLIYDVPSSIVR